MMSRLPPTVRAFQHPQVNAKLSELQGLLAFLDVRPFADPQAFNQLVHAAYERRASAAALPRMRALLSAHLLRRTKADPIVAEQLQLPPVEWVTVALTLAEAERAAYDAATSDLRASHEAFARAVDAASNARSAQSRLDESRRLRGVDAREYASAGAFSSLAQARHRTCSRLHCISIYMPQAATVRSRGCN